ncbi:hypothetical protein GOQ29_03265 [Clostridium sp. D2Q-14]|uniref:hypothetical protein n=1 Tax=Anaeromonas gelatinilytica TaxID=2683194 RepID=UPI00193B5A09|nr:hypothetical protein [Anaeromonas gelatinilytica]MBS4534629.1 hypothetical protein [Anaeromonas gelatinilytica]
MYNMYPCIPYNWMLMNENQEESKDDNYLKVLFERLVGNKVDILLNGRETVFKDLLVLGVKDNVVINKTNNKICVIPLNWIATVFIPEEVSRKVIQL